MNKTLFQILIISSIFFSCNTSKNTKTETKKIEQSEIKNLNKKADSLYQDDVFSEAGKVYSKLLNLDSLNGKYYYRRAYSYFRSRNPEFSPEDFKLSAELGYKKFDSFYNLGIIYSVVYSNDSLAISYFCKALEEKPDSKDVKLMLKNLGVTR